MKQLRAKLTFANVIASIALFVALGGSAFAATQLPGQSVGTKQLKKGAVTPGKLSSSAMSAMRGMTGATGAQGPQGSPGASAREPLLIDATGGAAEIKGQSGADLPLSGTTSWTSTSGQAAFLIGDVTATLAVEPGGFRCGIQIAIFVDGDQTGNLLVDGYGEALTEVSSTLPPIAFAVDQPGTHTVTAKLYGGSECSGGSKIVSFDVAVAPLGT